MKPASFIFRLLLMLSLLLVSSQTIMLLIFSQRVREDMTVQKQETIKESLALWEPLGTEILKALESGTPSPFVKHLHPSAGLWLQVLDASGRLVFNPGRGEEAPESTIDEPEIEKARVTGEGWAWRAYHPTGETRLFFAKALKYDGELKGFLRLATPTETLNREVSDLFSSYFFSSFLLLGTVLFWAIWYSRQFRSRIDALITTSEAFAKGLPYEPVYLEKPEELRILSVTLNRMYAQLENRIQTISEQKGEVEAILTGMIEGVIVLDQNFIIRRINPAAQQLFPSNRDHQGLSLIEVCRNSTLDFLARAIWSSSEGQSRGEVVLGDLVTTLQVQGAVLQNEEGKRWGLVLVLRDVTQLKKLETMRRDFVANVSHELKTPLTSVKGFVETLLAGALNQPETARKFLGIIERHTDRLTLIIDDLLQLSRLEQGQFLEAPQDCALEEVADAALQICQQRIQNRGLNLIRVMDPVSCPCHPALLEQALVNLLDNAIKFSPKGKDLFLTLRKDGTHGIFEVRDQGPGIPDKDKERIFERFYRTEKGRETEGTGLGLSIVKHILLLHKGTVEVADAPGGGTTFTLRIPLHP